MIIRFCAVAVSVVLFSMPSWAMGPDLSQEDYALMQSTYDSCKSSPFHTRYKCDCAAVSFVDRVADERNALIRAGIDASDIDARLYTQMDFMKSDAYRGCIDQDSLAIQSYGDCLEWALKTRDDYQDFCGCYAATYAAQADREGLNVRADPAQTMADAMIACNRRSSE